MNVIECNTYKDFFGAIEKAIKNNKTIIKNDDPKSLKCGVKIENTTYRMKIAQLKYAQKDGIDVSIYLNLK